MKNHKPILITLPHNLVRDLDRASAVLGWTRMALIRRCIVRDLRYVAQHELPRIRSATDANDYDEWLSRTMRPVLRS